MSADKRSFADFVKFPGKVNNGTGYYEFPLLKKIDSSERLRVWQIVVRLIKSGGDRLTGIDWDVLDEKQIPIKDIYYGHGDTYMDIPKGTIAEVWVETGIETGKITRSSPSYFEKSAHIGQINQRSPFHVALIYARGQYLKRKEKGSTVNSTGKKTKKSPVNVMYFPMLATVEKKGLKHLIFPLFVQPKLDGMRTEVFLKEKDSGWENVVVYTRTKKEYSDMDHIKILLYPYLNDLWDDTLKQPQSIYLDGETYKHGKHLQDINNARSSKKSRIAKKAKLVKESTKKKKEIIKNNSKNEDCKVSLDEINELHIYDCFYPLELDTAYESRKEQLDILFDALSDDIIPELGFSAKDVIKSVPTTEVKSLAEAKKLFEKYTDMGYEGIMMRNKDGVYLANADKTGEFMRSDNLVKMKQRFTNEFECVGYTQGSRGKDKGAIIWVAKTEEGLEFNVTPKNITYLERYELFEECEEYFDEKYMGRYLTIEYEDKSKSGKPLRAKALGFRDYE
jgi:ATP-dependent DNA ligase